LFFAIIIKSNKKCRILIIHIVVYIFKVYNENKYIKEKKMQELLFEGILGIVIKIIKQGDKLC